MKRAIFLVLMFLSLSSVAQTGNEFSVFTIDSFKENTIKIYSLQKHWRFHDGDTGNMAALSIDDSKWPITDPGLTIPWDKNIKRIEFSGLGWFRLHFTIDSALTTVPLCLGITHFGASEVYLDGNKISSNGKITDKEHTVYYDPQLIPIPIILRQQGGHIIAVKYANYNEGRNFTYFHARNVGIEMQIMDGRQITRILNSQTLNNTTIDIFLFGVFIALSMLHLFLFLYYRVSRTNLFFSLFCFSMAVIFLIIFLMRFSTSPIIQLLCSNLLVLIIDFACLSLSGFIYDLYGVKKSRFSIVLVLSILVPILFIIHRKIGIMALVSLGFTVLIQVILSVSYAFYKKLPGARILGTGVLFFALFMFFCMVFALSTGELNFSDSTPAGIAFLIITLIAILSLPISISLYLAWSFSNVNKDLQRNLDEVHDLSEKTLQQEQEKKAILENQKQNLEIEVTQRTMEVVAQKEKIEKQHSELVLEKNKSEELLKDIQVKNKSITDNITYAKRIQSAILPDIQLIYKTLDDSFILYLPKDIVSGDFYAFTEKHNKVLIIAGDCTGHGVSGALMSMIGSSLLNQIIIEKGVDEPAMILNQLNSAVIETFRQGENESNDGMDVSICSIDLSTNTLQFSGANRPLWLVRNGVLEVYKPDKFPIGGLQAARDRQFSNTTVQLQKGDAIYIFTDGYSDQFGGDLGKKLMSARFKELLLSINHMGMREQEEYLKNYFENWKGSAEQVDDVLVIGVRI